MSNTKRKHEAEEAQGPHDEHRKRKKHKKNNANLVGGRDRSLAHRESHTQTAVEKNAMSIDSNEQPADVPIGKDRDTDHHESSAIFEDAALGEVGDNGTPEEQLAKARRRQKQRHEAREELARMQATPSGHETQVKGHDENSKKKRKKRSKGDHSKDPSVREVADALKQQPTHKINERKERRKKEKEIQELMTPAEKESLRLAKAQKQLEKRKKASQDQSKDGSALVQRDGGHWHESSKSKRRQKGLEPGWKISEPIGGRMLKIDPLFSIDEK